MEEAVIPAAAHFALHIGRALDALPTHGLRGCACAFELRLAGFDDIRRARWLPAPRPRGQAANTLRPIRRPHIGRTVHRGAVDVDQLRSMELAFDLGADRGLLVVHPARDHLLAHGARSEEHTSELQSLLRT